jgi:5-deoxy-glucuronate isomerase
MTWITDHDDPTGIAFGVRRLAAGESLDEIVTGETALLLLDGVVSVGVRERRETLRRGSVFDERPSALHVAAGERVVLEAAGPVELVVCRAQNERPFEPALHAPAEVEDERRGRGVLHDTALRFVRTIFDAESAPPEADLVLGEVVTLPGRWSSYPPHHHPQPEIYHYRFTDPRGYGHAELGDEVVKVRSYDTVAIPAGVDHPQCAAPGYGMYYVWVIRHLPGARYSVPEFDPDHEWVMRPDARTWWPEETP